MGGSGETTRGLRARGPTAGLRGPTVGRAKPLVRIPVTGSVDTDTGTNQYVSWPAGRRQMAGAHVRIDNRLIHGQVTVAWTRRLGVRRLPVCNDDVAADDLQR